MEETKVEEAKNSQQGRRLTGGCLLNSSNYCVRALKRWGSTTILLFFVVLSVGVFVFSIDLSGMVGVNLNWKLFTPTAVENNTIPTESFDHAINTTIPINPRCGSTTNYSATFNPNNVSSQQPTSCPHYFRWIYEDLRTWKATRITRQTLESAKKYAHFRLIVFKGKVYLETYNRAYQTRDVFTIWGIVQLVRMYPGKVPDLELMFRCEDTPAIQKRDLHGLFHTKSTAPPVLFQYCGHDDSVGVVFPDWSYWGWPEVNVKPWNSLLNGITEGSKRIKWQDRIPYAYWKGNPESPDRQDLMTYN